MIVKKEPLRILHLKSTMVRAGSIEKIIASMIKKSSPGLFIHYVVFLKAPINDSADFSTDDVLNERIIGPALMHVIPWDRKSLLTVTLIRLMGILRKEQIRLIHCHDNRANFLGLIAGKLLGIPLVTTIYGWVPATPKLKLLVALDGMIIRYFNRVIASSDAMIKLIPDSILFKTDVITNAVNIDMLDMHKDRASIIRALGIGPEDIVATVIARLSDEKGHKFLLKAVQELTMDFPRLKFKLLVSGSGPLREELEALAEELGINDRVIFTGFHPDINEIYTVSDIIVQPSLSESLPVSLLEGMAFGKPAIATDVGSIREAVIDGKTGFLVKASDSRALSKALIQLFSNGEERTRMGLAAQRLIMDRFSDTAMVKKIEKIYNENRT